MKVEIRADGMHISGYVNVPGRPSRPIRSAMGKFIEVIEPGVFKRAIKKASEIKMLLDHDRSRVLASTANQTMKLAEDNVGLRAETVITDDEVIREAKAGNLRGWSFGMAAPQYDVEERAEGQLPIRRIKDIGKLVEISLIVNKVPYYQATSIEMRAGEEELVEYRAEIEEVTVEEEAGAEKPDLSEYKERLKKI